MTMKKQNTLHRFAAVAAVLLAFCLVFMMPAAADDTYTGGIVLPEYITADSFGPGMTVYDGTTYYATLTAALTGIHGTDNAVLYCKPDADVGQMTHGHVCKSLTVYGNGAHISGGEQDFEIDHLYPSGISCTGLTGDITLKVYNLTGAGAWGSRNSEYIINLEFVDCDDIEKILFNPSIKGTLDITLTDCTFIGDGNVGMDNDQCGVYSNANGEITLTRVIFSNVDKAVNLNHKVAGTQTITITDCTFTNCGSNVDEDEIPVRVLSSVEGGTSALTVSGCSFSGTPEGGADILLDYAAGLTTASVSGTKAKVIVETQNNVGETQEITSTETLETSNAVASINDDKYTTLAKAVEAANYGDTVTLLKDVNLGEITGNYYVKIGTKVTLDLQQYSITGTVGPNNPNDSCGLIYVGIEGDLTITGTGTITNNHAENYAIGNYGKVTVKGGTFNGKYALYNFCSTPYAGEAVIDGGKFESNSVNSADPAIANCGSLTINDGTVSGILDSTSKLIINDGSIGNLLVKEPDYTPVFEKKTEITGGYIGEFQYDDGEDTDDTEKHCITLTGGTFSSDVSEFVASGKVCVANVDGTFTVTDETHRISVSASSINFGTVTEGYSNSADNSDVPDVLVTVTNDGNSKVTLQTPQYDDTKFIVGSYKPNPAEIAPGDKVTFTISLQGALEADTYTDYITIQATPVQSGDNNVFDVYDEEVITVTFTVIEAPENEETVLVPTLPPIGVEENEDGTVTITVPEGTTDVKGSGEDTYLEIKTESDSQVTLMISGYTGDAGQYTLNSNSKIAASYVSDKPVDTNTEFSDNTVGLGVILELKKVNATLPVFSFDYDEETAEKVTSTYIKPLAMLKATHNAKEADADLKSVSLVFVVDKELFEKYEGLFFLYHVAEDGNSEQVKGTPTIDSTTYEEDDLVVITFTSNLGFSSYVLAVSTDSEGEMGGESPGTINTGSAVDTGSGNYQYYPRDVPADGIVSFGTSKVVTGIELPVGSTGKVTLNIKPTFAMPENGYYAFEIDAPGYNTDAKINGGLSFQIPVADLEAAGWTAEDIVLFHGTVGEDGTITWEALPTNLVKNENGVAYYKAAINGCSPFYIGFVKDGSVVNTEVVDPTTPETPVTPDEPEVLPPVDEPETPEQPTESSAPILAVLAGLGAAIVLRRK